MSNPAATGGADGAAGGGAPVPLTTDAIDAVLRDFRDWLAALPQETGDRSQESGDRRQETAARSLSPDSCLLSPGIDLFTLLGQLTALRHEVNMQTKASRAAVEQNA